MTTFTIKTANGFNTNSELPLNRSQIILKNQTNWVLQDSLTGDKYIFIGSDFTYNSNGLITGGLITKASQLDKTTGKVIATAQFSEAYDVTKLGYPSEYSDLLLGDDLIVGGAGDDVLGGGQGMTATGSYSYNGHSYLLSNAGTWTEAEAQAVSLGGHLVTINDQAEQDWIFSTFKDTQSWLLWIGYTDQEIEGTWKWISGENSTYSNWNSGEPNNVGNTGEDYAHIYTPYYGYTYYTGRWNDIPNLSFNGTAMRGIIELNNANTGNDTLKGGLGNDTYTVNSTGDKVIETANAGTDTVNSSITYKLTANVENLTLTGSETLKGLGNGLDNVITGNSAANVLLGYDGNDTLSGGLGNDNLQGGNGADTAVYSGVSTDYKVDYKNNILKITDTNLADGDDGVDTLAGVEELQFSNKTMLASDLLKAPGITEKYPLDTLAKFSQAAYWTSPSDRLIGVDRTDPNHTEVADGNSGQAAYSYLEGKNWQFLNFSDLSNSSSLLDVRHDEHFYYENGGASFQSEIDANNLLSQDKQKPEQQLIHGSAGAVVAVQGDSLVISFRGTEDVTAPGDTTWDALKPVAKAVVRYILESKYSISAADMDSANPNYDTSLNQTAATDALNFLKNVASGLSWGGSDLGLNVWDSASKKFQIQSLAELATSNGITVDSLAALANDTSVIKTDSYYWIQQDEHYELFKPLVEAVKNYVSDAANGIHKVYVTGHSLGAGMATWYMTDQASGGAFLQSHNVSVVGMSFATPGAVVNSSAELRKLVAGEQYYRFEVARDAVADTTQITNAGLPAVQVYSSQPGIQVNLQSTVDTEAYIQAVNQLHSMANYSDNVNLMLDSGLTDDLDFLIARTHISTPDASGRYDPVVLTSLSDLAVVGDGGQTGVTIIGDNGAAVGEYSGYAESYTENDIIVGTSGNDNLLGDDTNSFFTTDDIFYLGAGGTDRVFGFSADRDNGGIDTVVYKFDPNLLNYAFVSGDSDFHHHELYNPIHKVNVNLDGSPDSLFDIEKLHFVDTASDLSNLLAGNDGNNKIEGQGGNDYLFGNAGNDILTGGLGNDRIHGGKGIDTAKFAAGNYDFQVKDFALQVTNTTTHETDSLYSVENVTVGSVTRTAADIVWNGATAFNADGGTGLYSALDAKLLNLYAPAFGYTGTDADNLTVYGHAIQDSNTNKYTALQYELRETDTVTNDHWYLEILLGDDYLPKSFATLLDEASTSLVDPTAQVRNVWDTDVTYTDTHPFVYLDLDAGTDDVGPLYLTQEAVTPSKWLVPSGLENGTPYSLQLNGFDNIDFDYRSNSDTNDDIDKSDLYEIQGNPNGDVKLVGLPSGQMEMGFLFAGTPLANLGHFDLV